MNGFCYNAEQKKITIKDGTSVVIWESVEKEIAEKAGEMFYEACKDMDAFLLKSGCKRFWGYKDNHPENA